MEKTQAKDIIKNIFENKFDKAKFTNFIVNLLNINSKELIKETDVDFGRNYIPEIFNQHIDSFQLIGKYEFDKQLIDILVVNLKKETSLDRARTMQRNFIAWYLKNNSDINLKDAALVAFVSPDSSNWRFSLIKMDYDYKQEETGKVKIKEEFTPARRWSFLVGESENSHTAQSQLVELLADENNKPTLKNLEDAFNIEKVTKEFFKKYAELFNNLKDALEEIIKSDQKVKSDFETKSINSVDFSKKLLGQIVFLYFLQKKGWFGVKRDDNWGKGPKDFLRRLFDKEYIQYNNFFNDVLEPLFYEALRIDRSYDDDYLSMFKCKIPFLNGGLFDPINNYDWVHTDIILPNELFSNKNQTKEGDIGNGILDVFDRYNFTVKEDEPLEKEVAVDPEMLGKVFENLLEVKDRKSKGTYYTPREIVHYMCQQSLINYLATEMENILSKDEIENFVKYCEQVDGNEISTSPENNVISQNIISNAKLMDDKLADIKVCDPAVGSGAFLVGMMSEIVRARIALNIFLKDKTKTAYNLKRECIENSLYGVDIDPGAVEIAKLRLWLSLVVDEEDIKQIKPLPNLDYKIVCGNSLLGVEKNLFNQHLFSELEQNKKLLFNEVNPSKKQEYKKKIDELIFEITNDHKEFDFEIYFSEVFHKKGGFDIAIANPPYIFTRKMGFTQEFKQFVKEYFLKDYQFSKSKAKQSGKINLYSLFIIKSILISNYKGIVTYVVPNTILRATTYDLIRKYILDNTQIEQIIDLGGGIFDSVTASTIIIILKRDNINKKERQDLTAILNIEDLEKRIYIKNLINQNNFYLNISYSFNIFINTLFTEIFKKILYSSKMLGELCLDIIEGIVAHKNLIINENIENSFPILEGKNIKPFFITNPSKRIIWKPKEIHRIRPDYLWEIDKKIVIQRISGGNNPLVAAIDNKRFKTFASVNNLVLKEEYRKYYNYILALLNSKLFNFYYSYNFSNKSELTVNISKTFLEKLPVKLTNEKSINTINNIVNEILTIHSLEKLEDNEISRRLITELQEKLNLEIYKIYGIGKKGIDIIERELSSSKTK